MCKEKNTAELFVIDMDTPFVTNVPDYETYALFYMKNAGHDMDRYVKISNPNSKKSIYRKSSGRNGVLSSQVALAHKTQKELGVQLNSTVTVTPTSFWAYYWYNSERYIRWTFRTGVVGFFISVLASSIDLIKEVICWFM